MSTNPPKQPYAIFVVLTTLTFAASIVVLGRAYTKHSTKRGGEQQAIAKLGVAEEGAFIASSSPVSISSSSIIGPAQIVRFTVYDEGIRPSVARVSPGPVVIYVNDLSTISAGLTLQNAVQVPIGQVVPTQTHRRGSAKFLLLPGRYAVSESNRPSHSATLIVQP